MTLKFDPANATETDLALFLAEQKNLCPCGHDDGWTCNHEDGEVPRYPELRKVCPCWEIMMSVGGYIGFDLCASCRLSSGPSEKDDCANCLICQGRGWVLDVTTDKLLRTVDARELVAFRWQNGLVHCSVGYTVPSGWHGGHGEAQTHQGALLEAVVAKALKEE